MPEARVAITGIGVVSPLGLGRAAFWEGLSAGRSAIGRVRRFDPGPDPPRLGAEVADFSAREFLPAALVRRMDRLSQMIGVAAAMAASDSALGAAAGSGDDLAVVVGSALGNMTESAQFLDRLFTKGPGLANPMLFPNLVMNAPASQVSMALGWRGPNLTVSAGEISGEAALEAALGILRRGRARAAVAAAGDELAEVVFRALKDFRYLSPRDGRAERSCPFDAAANGPVMGEGAAALLLEPEEVAAARGARVYATVTALRRFAVECPSPHLWPRPGRALELAPADLVVSGADSSPERDALERSLLADLPAGGPAPFAAAGLVGSHGSMGLANVAIAALRLHASGLGSALVLGTARGGAGVTIELERAGAA